MLICSFAQIPPYTDMLNIMSDTVIYYAAKHRMDTMLLTLPDSRLDPASPTAGWDKIILLNHMLKFYETILWVDADSIIIDPAIDIRRELDPKCCLHIVAHHYGGKTVPNVGIMVISRKCETFEFLDAIWNHKEMHLHPWAENAAIMDLIGLDPRGFSCTWRGPSRFTAVTQYIDNRWNSIGLDPAEDPRIIHFAGVDKAQALESMKSHYKTFTSRFSKK